MYQITKSVDLRKSPISNFRYSQRIPQAFASKMKLKAPHRSSIDVPLNLSHPIRSQPAQYFCKICDGGFLEQQLFTIGNCRHKFCRNCLFQYATYKVNVHEMVLCPQENCPQKLTTYSPLFARLTRNIKEKFKKQELWRQTMDNPNIKLCPQQNCKDGIVDLTIQPPQCRKCQHQFCPNCMMKYHSGKCDDNFLDYFKEFKRCPKCGIAIQKIEGCNRMQCLCFHQFCFVCLNQWDDSHYSCNQRVFQLQPPIFYVRQHNRTNMDDSMILVEENIEQQKEHNVILSFLIFLILVIFFPITLILLIALAPVFIFVFGGIFFTYEMVQETPQFILLLPFVFLFNGFRAVYEALKNVDICYPIEYYCDGIYYWFRQWNCC